MWAIWQHLGRLLATFSPRMCRNGYFSWHLLDRVATPWDHNDPVCRVNSCFTQIFDRTKIILFLIVFPRRLHRIPENSRFQRIPWVFQVFRGLWSPGNVVGHIKKTTVSKQLKSHYSITANDNNINVGDGCLLAHQDVQSNLQEQQIPTTTNMQRHTDHTQTIHKYHTSCTRFTQWQRSLVHIKLAVTLWWFTDAPKPLKIQVVWGHPVPRGRTAPIF